MASSLTSYGVDIIFAQAEAIGCAADAYYDASLLSSSSKKNKKTTAMLDPIVELDVAPNASVLGVQWHPKLNQIAFGTSNGM